MLRHSLLTAFLVFVAVLAAHADTLIFLNGDQLSGTLVRADASACVFNSAMAGTVTVPWKNVRELRTETPFVVVGTNQVVHQGVLLVNGKDIEITAPPAPPVTVEAAATRMVVDPKTYREGVTAHPALWQGWRGSVTAGFSAVAATQDSTSLNGQILLQRPLPALAWLPQRSNTQFHFQGNYGRLSQPGNPTIKTSIFTTGLEQDEYLSSRFFGFGDAQLDHNYAQGLQLQQAYGGGAGWKWIQTPVTQLALKADLHYTHQQFLGAPTNDFIASSFTEALLRKFGKLVWTENVSLTPSYSQTNAYQMSGLTAWALPVYRALSLNVSLLDSYINNPQPGFQKNSLQFTTGLQFAIH